MQADASAEIDNRIITSLVRNGRGAFAHIGAEVGLSAHAVAERVRRMERRGIILGYTAVLDESRQGRSLEALVDVRLLPTTDPVGFEDLALSLDTTRQVMFLTGRFDYLVHLVCRDRDDLDVTVRELRSRGAVAATETRIVMRRSGRSRAGADAVRGS